MKKIDQLIFLIGVSLIILSFTNSSNHPIIPKPDTPVVVPDVIPPKPIPDLKTNILYDEYEKSVELSKIYNRPLIVIFGAKWCPYCRDLKKDVTSIKQFTKTIVCFIDTDENTDFVDKFDIKGLPTSVLLNKDKEKSRHSGYKKDSYEKWLDANLL